MRRYWAGVDDGPAMVRSVQYREGSDLKIPLAIGYYFVIFGKTIYYAFPTFTLCGSAGITFPGCGGPMLSGGRRTEED